VSPASLGDLLEEAETAAVQLNLARPPLEAMAATWPTYSAAAERVLQACVGARASNNPVDAALWRTAAQAKAARAGIAPASGQSGDNNLGRISELLSAATDLLNTHPSLEPAAAQLAGLRAAAVIAAASHAVVVAERTRANEGVALRALRLERVAARALEQRAWPARLDEPRAVPGSDPTEHNSVGEAYQLATDAWRRIGALDFNPSDHVLRTGALSIAHVTTDLRFVLSAASIKVGLDDDLRVSQERWDTVAQAWSGFTTATPLTPDARATAQQLRDSSSALRAAARTARDRGDHGSLEELLTAATRGHRDMAALGSDQLSITRRLTSSGRLYVAARDLPPDEDRIEARLRGQFVPSPLDRLAPLVEPYTAAVRHSARAVAAVDLALTNREVPGRPPRLEALTDLAVRSPHLSRGR
jgi:hypothetical protein